jgi:hypothetical protein
MNSGDFAPLNRQARRRENNSYFILQDQPPALSKSR